MLQLLGTKFCRKLFGRKRKEKKLGLKVCQAGVRRFLPQRLHSHSSLLSLSSLCLWVCVSTDVRYIRHVVCRHSSSASCPQLHSTASPACSLPSLPSSHSTLYIIIYATLMWLQLVCVFFSTFHFSIACKTLWTICALEISNLNN